ncbi:multidrug efflux pump subunit AcrA (membrane-fusion protein) [Chryseobacterium sp. PvR013]|uniref:efflux RND transporter periplasmic adaptor subunit n=1 Tax=Chryseobacterium sp. PvR013 TaxID=2806595 RepID=UPI001AE2EB9D|nr:efflux RND transporter periplasmic adaptor subunit [Chryseobacterium sp. PvR013]MBP1164486.1 multidrug efflux pump subunit AcrA (membrane-fusion protein) [Chryseobacterium sp. PvR013]
MKKLFYLLLVSVFTFSCKKNVTVAAEEAKPEMKPKTEVNVAYPSDTIRLSNTITLNATATYLLKSDAKANSTGYITHMTIRLGDRISKGSVLFGLQTKEARALGNTINKLDKSFRFSGTTTVVSPATGYVVMLNHQIGDYVQDGEILATITDASSFGFVVDVPYEYLQLIKTQNSLSVKLPDGNSLPAKVAKVMPSVDAVSQTVKVLLQIAKSSTIPENLIGTVTLSKSTVYGLSVPKMAVLSDETQSSFWVMKMINDTTAIKTPVVKGTETDQYIQIKSGNITTKDKVITSGNFGLRDTATVKIKKH